MSEETKKIEWPQIIDKLTDPLELAVTKIFSARFLMAVTVSVFGCLLTWKICQTFGVTNKELVALVVGQFFMIWRDIAKDYFNRADRDAKKEQVKP